LPAALGGSFVAQTVYQNHSLSLDVFCSMPPHGVNGRGILTTLR